MSKLTLSIVVIVGMLMIGSQAFGALAIVEPKNLVEGDGHYASGSYAHAGGAFNGGSGNYLWEYVDPNWVNRPRPVDTDDTWYHHIDQGYFSIPRRDVKEPPDGPGGSICYFVIDFGSSKTIDTVWLWNFHSVNAFKDVEITMSDTGSRADDATFGASADWSGTFAQGVPSVSIPPAGKTGIFPEAKEGLGLSGRFLKFRVVTNYGTGTDGGEWDHYMNPVAYEVAFFTPEPATMALMGLGTLGTVLLRKRNGRSGKRR